MQLSIIIINFNTFDLTCKCIKSVFKSIKDISYEVIVVDNASEECSPYRIKELFPFIILLPQKVNLGFAKGNNVGLAVATGEVVLLLNSDTEILGRAIEESFEYLVARPDVGVVSCKLIYPTGDLQAPCQRFPSIGLEMLELTRIQKLLGRSRQRIMLGFFFDHEHEMKADWVWGTFFMVKREVIKRLPQCRFPDDFFMYGEDMEWCYIIQKLGYKIMYYPKGVIIHHVSMSSTAPYYFDKLRAMRNNEFEFLERNFGTGYARTVFTLRSLNYLSLIFRDRKFYSLAIHYFKRAIQ
jgi:GT2 family glycosyltransferase